MGVGASPRLAPITAIVPTRNEAANVEACLRTLQWVDQLFVVDSQSTDGTLEIAQRCGAEVVQFHYDGGWPKKKNWAIRNLQIRNPWILIIDADERVSPELREEMEEAVTRQDIHGYYVRWRFIFLDRWMKHSWSHGWMLRLFRKGHGEYEDLGMRGEAGWDNEVHENICVQEKVGKLSNDLIHHSHTSLADWIGKQNEFSTWNAARRLNLITAVHVRAPLRDLLSADPRRQRAALKALYLRLPLRPLLMFLYLFVMRAGFLDGRAGFYFCALRAAHELNIDAKMYELALNGSGTGPLVTSSVGPAAGPAIAEETQRVN